jgi:hypothetical protein
MREGSVSTELKHLRIWMRHGDVRGAPAVVGVGVDVDGITVVGAAAAVRR